MGARLRRGPHVSNARGVSRLPAGSPRQQQAEARRGDVRSGRARARGRGPGPRGPDGSGWAFPELDLVEPTVGGAPLAHRDALKLLAVFIQHTDSKPEQQRLMCAPGEQAKKDEPCLHTFMMISDLGLTFGHANVYNRSSVGSVNFEQWSRTKIWSDPKECIGEYLPVADRDARSSSDQRGRPQISRRSARPTHGCAAARPVRRRTLPRAHRSRAPGDSRRVGRRLQAEARRDRQYNLPGLIYAAH